MRHRRKVNEQDGYALLVTLLAILLITVVGLSLITMSMNTMRVTKSERDNQSSYYIAEAGLVEKRAQLNEIARQVYAGLKKEYDLILDPLEKETFNLEGKFTNLVQKQIKDSLALNDHQIYAKQHGGLPESQVTVTPDAERPLVYKITSVGKITSADGYLKEKTVSQTVKVQMNDPTSMESIEIPGNPAVQKLKTCFAVQAYDDITLTNGTINGDVYAEKNFYIPSGWPTIDGSVISKSGVSVSGGVIEGDIVSYNDISINAWMPIGGDVIARRNINVNEGPNSLGGKYIYGNAIAFNGNFNSGLNHPSKKEKRNDIDAFLAGYLSSEGIECTKTLPSLPDVNQSFPSTQASVATDQKIHYNGHQYDVIKDGALNINNWVVRDSKYELVLTKDMYFKQINISENNTLKIDLQNKDRRIYVDNFNNVQGHIKLINPGKLEIIVQDKFHSKGELNTGGKSENLNVRYAGSDSISLNNETLINGSLHVKKAKELTINANGIKGDLIAYASTDIKISGGSSVSDRLILAPFSTLSITGGGKVRGNVIIRNLGMDGGATIIPPSENSGEWEVPGSPAEIIEVPVYEEGSNFLVKDSLKQE